jgi:hypothetical protein
MFLRPYTRAIPSPILSTRPVSSRSAFGADPKMRSSRIEEISAPRLFGVTWSFRAATDVAGKATPAT